MRIKTIYKEIDKIYSLFLSPKTSDRREALVRLSNLREKLKAKVEEKEVKPSKGKQIQGLLGWYLRVWNGKPPEYLRHSPKVANGAIAKNLKELLEIYEGDENRLKEEYLEFKEADPKRLKWEQKRLLWDRGVFNFRNVLSRWKQLKEEEAKTTRRWGAYDRETQKEELELELEKLLEGFDAGEK
jgi:hypothetical protein